MLSSTGGLRRGLRLSLSRLLRRSAQAVTLPLYQCARPSGNPSGSYACSGAMYQYYYVLLLHAVEQICVGRARGAVRLGEVAHRRLEPQKVEQVHFT